MPTGSSSSNSNGSIGSGSNKQPHLKLVENKFEPLLEPKRESEEEGDSKQKERGRQAEQPE